MTARPAPTRRPDRIWGRAKGMTTLVNVCQRLAPSARAKSTARASVVDTAAVVVSRIGTNAVTAAKPILDVDPMPSHNTASGYSTTQGKA